MQYIPYYKQPLSAISPFTLGNILCPVRKVRKPHGQ